MKYNEIKWVKIKEYNGGKMIFFKWIYMKDNEALYYEKLILIYIVKNKMRKK